METAAGKGLLLDLDGTLADSLPVLKAAYFSFLQAHHSAGTEPEFQQLNGVPLATIIERLKQAHALPEPPSVLLARYTKLIESSHESAPPAEGALTVLQMSRSRGWRVAVVTSSPHRMAEDWIVRSGLRTMVDTVVGGDEVQSGKPSPEPYSLGLKRLDCVAARSLAVEDSPIGATSALAAGLPTLAISGHQKPRDWPSGVQLINRFADILDRL